MSQNIEPNHTTNTTATISVTSNPSKATNQYQNDNTMLYFALIVVALGTIGISYISVCEFRAKKRKEELAKIEAEKTARENSLRAYEISAEKNPYN